VKRWPIVVAALGVLLVAALAGGAWKVERYAAAPLPVGEAGIGFEIVPGSSFARVSQELADIGLVRHPVLLRIYARLHALDGRIHAGEYHIQPGSTVASLLEQFTSGDVRLYSFTLVEGWNRWDLLRALAGHPQIETTMSDEDWPALLEELNADTLNPEGLFLPETYHFPRGTTDRKVLQQAYTLMRSTLAEEWPDRAVGLPFDTPYEALVLASIVEKETALADERARIAGVFVRRLENRMRLQTDPTVIYGIGPAFNGNLTRKDLRTDTVYNTYTRHGLPPTPIAMPGRDAIRAALNPAHGTELYFVATGLGDGSHKFSETKEQHDAAVAEYLRRLRQRRNGGGE